MFLRIALAITSLIIPFVGLLGGLYHLRVFKKTVVKRTGFAIFLMVLTLPTSIVCVVSLGSPSTSPEVTIEDKTEAVATPMPIPTATPAPTPTPAPTATPVPTATPIVHEFSGTGDRVLGPIMLEPGILLLTATHNGQSNFIVQIVGTSGSKEYSINEIGRYSGVRAHTVSSGSSLFDLVSGDHRFQVQADGPWSLKLRQERPSGGQRPPSSDESNGDNVFRWLNLQKGQYVLTASHEGQSNFIVELLKSDGGGTKYLVNKIGAYSGQTLISVSSDLFDLKPGLYALVVQADGHWTFAIE